MGRGLLQQAITQLRSVAQSRKCSSPNSPLQPERFYHPELDSIRLLLFVGVWVYHAVPRYESYYIARHIPAVCASLITDTIRAGSCSLDVFFVLSAFLITELILREKELQGTVNLKMFYIRRLLRIWPLYFFTIGLAAFVSMCDTSQKLSAGVAAGFLVFAGNWIIIFHGSPGASMLNPLWSVSFEEQFYLFWPLVLRRATRSFALKTAAGLLLLANISRLILLLHHADARSLWINSFVRLDSIACGILLAIFLHGRSPLRIGRDFRLALFLLAGCIWLAVGRYCGLHDPEPPLFGTMIGYPLMTLGAVGIFVSVFGASQDGVVFLKHPALVYLGKISYGLYAFHILALRCAYYLFRNYHHGFQLTLSSITSLAITFLLAGASYRWLESPFLRLKQKKFTNIPSGSLLEPQETHLGRAFPQSSTPSRRESDVLLADETDSPSAVPATVVGINGVRGELASSSIEGG